MTRIAIVHDYLTQRGGAERVVLSMLKAFPDAPLYTSFYDPQRTFPEFADVHLRTLPINAVGPLRRHYRMAMPVLARAFSRCIVEADVVLCSSSGWAHGAVSTGRKLVYCYAPARWLYQPTRYLGEGRPLAGAALAAMRPYLLRWDRHAAGTADAYLTSSRAVASGIRSAYGVESEIVPPPHTVDVNGPTQEVCGLKPGFVLCVSRLRAYKNLYPILEAFGVSPDLRLIVVGSGPEGRRLQERATPNVRFLGSVTDPELRWLYQQCAGLVAASYEDFGLTPLEAAAFGKPASVLRWGGFLDTVLDGETGVFFDTPSKAAICAAVRSMVTGSFPADVLQAHAAQFSEHKFITRLRYIVNNALSDPIVPVAGGSQGGNLWLTDRGPA